MFFDKNLFYKFIMMGDIWFFDKWFYKFFFWLFVGLLVKCVVGIWIKIMGVYYYGCWIILLNFELCIFECILLFNISS